MNRSCEHNKPVFLCLKTPRLAATVLLGLAVSLFCAGLAWAQPDDVVLEGDVLQQVEGLRERAGTVQQDIDNLDLDLERIVEEHNATRVNLDQLTMALADSRIRLDEARALRERQVELISQRMVAVYKADEVTIFSILLDSTSFSDFYDQTHYMMKIGEQDAKLDKQLRETADEISDITDEIDSNRDRKSTRLNSSHTDISRMPSSA